MKVARTELTDLCKKVFEGMKFPLGDYEDCAQVIAWLEFHGLPVLEQIQRHAPAWELPRSQAAAFLFESETVAIIDAQHNGGLVYGGLALDLAYLKALQHGLAWVHLHQARFQQLILPSLVKCAGRGMNCLVLWREADYEHVAAIEARQQYPTYLTYRLASPAGPDPLTLSLCCATNLALLPKYTPTAPNKAPISRLTPADFARNHQYYNEKGIEVDEAVWARLVALSKNVLVEATEESRRRGAGEQDLLIS